MRPRFAWFLVPLVAALLAPVFAACSNEGEGQPCDPNAGNSGNDDCQSPLVCTTGLTNATGARCCPQNRTTATTPECKIQSESIPDANSTPPDSTLPDDDAEPGDSSTSEAAPDAPVESSVEAGVDTGTVPGTDGGDAGSLDASGG